MVLIGLLLVALVCLILGLVLASGPWLIGSLVASAVAGIVLWRQREQIARAGQRCEPPVGRDRQACRRRASTRQTSLVTGTAFAGKTGGRGTGARCVPARRRGLGRRRPAGVPRAGLRPDRGHGRRGDPVRAGGRGRLQGVLGLHAGAGRRSRQVWVIDGRPDYHRKDCSRVSRGEAERDPAGAGRRGRLQRLRPVPSRRGRPHRRAGVDDRAPDGATQQPTSPQREPSRGRRAAPRRRAGASRAAAAEPEPPAAGRATRAEVWVVDGRPRYHLEDCMIIKDQDAEPIPLAQATEDGFMPCSMCEPNVTRV